MFQSVQKWSLAKVLTLGLAVAIATALVTVLSSMLVLEKSVQVGEAGDRAFVSYAGHPECSEVRTVVAGVAPQDGPVVEGDAGPCRGRNTMILVLQVTVLLAAIGWLLGVTWTWLSREEPEPPAVPAG